MVVYLVVKCCSCDSFQTQQEKKSKKWNCVVCATKQSFTRIFFHSTKSSDCRPKVQELNAMRATMGDDSSLVISTATTTTNTTTNVREYDDNKDWVDNQPQLSASIIPENFYTNPHNIKDVNYQPEFTRTNTHTRTNIKMNTNRWDAYMDSEKESDIDQYIPDENLIYVLPEKKRQSRKPNVINFEPVKSNKKAKFSSSIVKTTYKYEFSEGDEVDVVVEKDRSVKQSIKYSSHSFDKSQMARSNLSTSRNITYRNSVSNSTIVSSSLSASNKKCSEKSSSSFKTVLSNKQIHGKPSKWDAFIDDEDED